MTSQFTRRTFVAGSGAAAAAIALGGNVGLTPAVMAQDAGEVVIPDPAVTLPTDDVTFRWIDSGDLKAIFYAAFHEAYMAKHPNIEVQYDALPWEEIGSIVPLGVQSGDAHDIFAMPLEIPPAQAVAEGWVAPLDDIIPDFETWKGRFPLGSFIDGVHEFDGLTYTFPQTSAKRYWSMTFSADTIMEQAGVDLAAEPLTFESFRETARVITEQGQGQYYGLIVGGQTPGRFGDYVRNFARLAGASAGGSLGFTDIDWRTGEFVYTSDEYRAAVDLLQGIWADGSAFPGSMSLNEAQARAQFPQGVAGMILEGPWCIPQWQRDAPDFAFSLSSQPVPDGAMVPMTYEETGSNQLWVYADSAYKEIAGDMFSYIGSVDGQVAIMATTGGNLRAILPEAAEIAQESVELDPLATIALGLYDEQLRLGPMLAVRNPATARLAQERRPLTPDLGEIVQGILVGQIDDVGAALQDLQDRAEAELERSIAAAQEAGAEITRDDFVFANWDPTLDYTSDRYEQL